MTYLQIASPDPAYLAATDILIGDMSDINYEFLLFDRPVILLANQWLCDNFPDIGIKTDLASLEHGINRSLLNPNEYTDSRKYWLDKTMNNPDGSSSNRVVDCIIKHSKINNPYFLLIHGGDEVLKTHLESICMALKERNIKVDYINRFKGKYNSNNVVCLSANNSLLEDIPYGYKVHIDHGVKGVGVTDFEKQLLQYKDNDYFPSVDLHITEGEVSYEKTKKLIGPYSNRAVMVGYPKSDILLRLKKPETKIAVCKSLNINPQKPLITYAPAGIYQYPFKQGGSLSYEVLRKLKRISKSNDYNVLIKLKNKRHNPYLLPLKKIKSFVKRKFGSH